MRKTQIPYVPIAVGLGVVAIFLMSRKASASEPAKEPSYPSPKDQQGSTAPPYQPAPPPTPPGPFDRVVPLPRSDTPSTFYPDPLTQFYP